MNDENKRETREAVELTDEVLDGVAGGSWGKLLLEDSCPKCWGNYDTLPDSTRKCRECGHTWQR